MAVGRQYLDVARLLLQSGADPNRRDGFGEVPLDRASTREAVALLLQFGASESMRGRAPVVSLLTAAWDSLDRGDYSEQIRALLARGLNPSAVLNGRSLLERALFLRRGNVARVLADAGARIHMPDEAACTERGSGCHMTTVARLAAFDAGVVKHLKGRGLNINQVDASGRTALMSVIGEPPAHRVVPLRADGLRGPALERPSLLGEVQVLLAEGADPNLAYRGTTALALAVAGRSRLPELATILFEAGGRIDVNYTVPAAMEVTKEPSIADDPVAAVHSPILDDPEILEGMTIGPASWLHLYGRPDLALRTIQRSGKLEPADRYLLYFAAAARSWDLVRQVLPFVRTPDAANRAGVTALMLAVDDGELDVVRLLLQAGVDVNTRTAREWPSMPHAFVELGSYSKRRRQFRLVGGLTPLQIATRRGHEEIAHVLKAAGASE